MDWFLYDNGLRHKRVNSRGLHLNGKGVLQFAKNLIQGIRKLRYEKELLRQKKVSWEHAIAILEYRQAIFHTIILFSTQCKKYQFF